MPGSTNERFYMPQVNGYIPHEVTEKIIAAVGFRNLLVHKHAKAAVDLQRCIRCGLRVTTCPTEALRLDAKPQTERQGTPFTAKETMMELAQERGKTLIPLALAMSG